MRIGIDRRGLLILALVAAAAASWWWSAGEDAPRIQVMGTGGDQPDYVLADFLLTEMGEDGRPGHTLTAENLYHYADRKESVLAHPQLLLYEEDRATWDISARHGLVSDAQRSVFLSGDVEVRYAGTTAERSFQIYTGELHVWPEERRAETAEAVRIDQQSSVTHSVGMRAELDVRRIHLLSQVRGNYEP